MGLRLLWFVGLSWVLGAALGLGGAAGSVRSLPPPVLSVTVNADGSLHASWSKAANENSIEFVYDDASHSSGRLTDVASLNSSGGCPRDMWCWPAQGTPLYCYDVLHVENTGSCAGIQDLGDSQTQEDTSRLTIGATYWVQVLVKDSCVNAGNCAPGQIAAWSNVVPVVDNPPTPAGGGGTSGGGTSGGGASQSAAQVVRGSAVIQEPGKEVDCTPLHCDVQTLPIGSEIMTPADGFLRVKTKQWGTILIGPNTRFLLSKAFADIAGGEVEFEFGTRPEGPCKVYVAPLPPTGKTVAAPANPRAEVDAENDPDCDGVWFYEHVYSGHVVVDDVKGNATVSSPHGGTHHISAGQEQQVAGGALPAPTKLRLVTCDLRSLGFGVFCPRG